MSDASLAIRPVDLLALLLTRTPAVKETPVAQAQIPPREFSEYVLAAAAAQGIVPPPRTRPTHRVSPPARPPQKNRSKRGRPEAESPPSNPNWV